MNKRIEFNRDDKDFSAFLNDQYIGSYRNHLAAEVALDALAVQQIADAVVETDLCFHCDTPLSSDESEVCRGCWVDPTLVPVRNADDAPSIDQLIETLMDPDTSPVHYAKAKIVFDALVEAMDAGWTPSLLELAQEAEEVLEFGGPVARLLGLPLSPPEFGRAA